jgi:predicted nucleic acid-binding protein
LILIDTSALIDSLCGPRRSFRNLQALIASGERVAVGALVLYEWLRGPRLRQELIDQEGLFPSQHVIAFGSSEATVAADLYRRLKNARGREIDLAIAATALTRDAALWTLNEADFRDIPGLRLVGSEV